MQSDEAPQAAHSIELIPAIDVIGGRVVRLTRGDYATEKAYGDDPLDMAKRFADLGFRRLHLVDLDGARSQHVVNWRVLERIASHTALAIDFGGGVKSDADLRAAFENGAQWVTVGSLAATAPDTLLAWADKHGAQRFIVGADAEEDEIKIHGWEQGGGITLIPFLKSYYDKGLKHFLCTDIGCDGTLGGPNVTLYRDIMTQLPESHLIASGGVGSAADIDALQAAGIPAVVFGKAIYEGRLSLEALARKYLY